MQDIQNANGRLFDAPEGKVNLTPSWQAQNTRGQTNMLTFEWDAFENAQITGGIGYNNARYYGNFASPTVTSSGLTYNSGRARLTDQRFKTLSMNLTARGEFETGPVSHNWSTAFDRIDRKRTTYQGARQTRSSVIDPSLDIPTQLAKLDSNLGSAWNTTPSLDTVIKVNSLAVSDTLGFADNKYRLTLGGRFQAVEQKNKLNGRKADANRFSPMLMAAWVPQPDLVVYGNYMEDLEPSDIRTDDDGHVTMADPRVSRQFEVGVRKNWGDFVTTFKRVPNQTPGLLARQHDFRN